MFNFTGHRTCHPKEFANSGFRRSHEQFGLNNRACKLKVSTKSIEFSFFLFHQNILQALSRATEGRTSICIAHRLSTVMDADEILVLENGKIGERGTHDELLKKRGLYAKLWDTQNRL